VYSHTADAASQREVAAVIEHVLADRPGDWRASIIESQANDRWDLRARRERRPEVIRAIVASASPAWTRLEIP